MAADRVNRDQVLYVQNLSLNKQTFLFQTNTLQMKHYTNKPNQHNVLNVCLLYIVINTQHKINILFVHITTHCCHGKLCLLNVKTIFLKHFKQTFSNLKHRGILYIVDYLARCNSPVKKFHNVS